MHWNGCSVTRCGLTCNQRVKAAVLVADQMSIGAFDQGLSGRRRKSRHPGYDPRPEEVTMDDLHDKHVEIDERWLSEWFEFGFSELSTYLAKHAAFDDYCHRHETDF